MVIVVFLKVRLSVGWTLYGGVDSDGMKERPESLMSTINVYGCVLSTMVATSPAISLRRVSIHQQ